VHARDRLSADYEAELADAKRTALAWVREPLVRPIVENHRDSVRGPVVRVAQAIGVHPATPGQYVYAGMVCIAVGASILAEAGTGEPLTQWRVAVTALPDAQHKVALTEFRLLLTALISLAARIEQSGAKIDRGYSPDLVVLAQLCRLESDDDWSAAESGRTLVFIGPRAFRRDGRGPLDRLSHVVVRRPDRVGRIQRAILESQTGHKDLSITPAESGRRGATVPKQKASRRLDALRAIDAKYGLPPTDRSAAMVVHDSWGKWGAGKELAEITGYAEPPVGKSQLARDFAEVRRPKRAPNGRENAP